MLVSDQYLEKSGLTDLPSHDMKLTSDINLFFRTSKQQVNLLLFVSDWYSQKLELKDLPGHDGKSRSDMNLILGFYERP